MVSPVCYRRCGTCGRRERTSWHFNIWQYETIIHGAVLRPPKTACLPQGCSGRCARRRITALFEAQAIRDGTLCHERCGHKPLHETARAHMEAAWEGDIEGEGCSRLFRSRVWVQATPPKGATKATSASWPTSITSAPAPCTPFIPYSRLQEKSAATAREVAERIYEESLTECQLAKREARFREDTSQGGARLPDGRGDVRRVLVYRQGIGCCSPRPPLLVDDALAVAKMKRVAGILRKEREGILNWWERSLTNSFLEGLNSPAQSVRNTARGFRNISYFGAMVSLRLENSTSRPRGSWPVLPTRNVEELKNKSRTHRFGSSD
ncbi:MAG: hypothetical protein DUD39_03245 [Coriobacteriaceae bacterium]|nr:MAG: hypothetical protein DUD39_03245 [Coriobacteriaceae bacterium]